MPKRKRGNGGVPDDDPAAQLAARKLAVEKKLFHGKIVLARVLKNAKTLLLLKLQRKIKMSGAVHGVEQGRVVSECELLKNLDLKLAIAAYLQKTLLKSKKWADSALLPEEIREPVYKLEESEEERARRSNVTSRLWATKSVKSAVGGVVDSLYKAAELENPAAQPKSGVKAIMEKQDVSPSRPVGHAEDESVTIEDDDELEKPQNEQEPAWEGFDAISTEGSDDEEEQENLGQYDTRISNSSDDGDKEEDGDGDDDKDAITDEEEEYFSRYDSLIANSSDSDGANSASSDDGIRRPSAKSKITSGRDLSLSPSRSSSLSPSPSHGSVLSLQSTKPKSPKDAKRAKPSKKRIEATLASTFLPTLMGGYYSGSNSAASDIDSDIEALPPPRKNRMGQQARRALAEKKFGKSAKHIRAGKGPAVARQKDDWDARRGARLSSGAERGRGRGRGGFGSGARDGFVRSREQFTGENATPVTPRARGMGRKDDAGPLHASWVAKKLAKETLKTAKFEGKKVVFD